MNAKKKNKKERKKNRSFTYRFTNSITDPEGKRERESIDSKI